MAAVVAQLGMPDLDHVVCYQSRVTPQKWIGPSTELELERAAHDEVAVLVCPIAFVSEHSETLVELDVEYREEAERLGVPGYFRVPGAEQRPRLHRRAARPGAGRRGPAAGRSAASPAGGNARRSFGDCPHAKANRS